MRSNLNKLIIVTIVLFFIYSCSDSLSDKQKEEYIIKGNKIAMSSAKALESSLGQEMKNGGIEAAIPFCNTLAYPLTEKLSVANDVIIKRTSDKFRNEKNAPNEDEIEVISYYKKLNGQNNPLKPVVQLNDNGSVYYYAPIVVKKKCLICHGSVGKELTYQTDSIIKSYYISDRATEYAVGDLRGIWSINFSK